MSAEELLRKIEQGEVVTINGKVVCTGAMWYDRFEKELPDGFLYTKDAVDQMMKAAKKASGL